MNRNQKEFPTYAHRVIWSKGLLLVPPEESTRNLEEERKKAHFDLCSFLADVYEDMYHHPEEYGINCERIEEALQQKRWRKAKIIAEHHHQEERLKKLNEIKRTEFFVNLLAHCISNIQLDSGIYFEKQSKFKNCLKGYKSRYSFPASDDTLEKALKRNGFCVQYADDRAIFTNDKYPGMFQALYDWGSSIRGCTKNPEKIRYKTAFQQLDCRVFQPDYKVTLESVMFSMSDEIREFMIQIEEFLQSIGLKLTKPDQTIPFSLGCKYKGITLAYFTWEDAFPVFRVGMFTASLPKTNMVPSPQYAEFERRVKALPQAEEMKKLCFRYMIRCRKCGCCEKYFHVPPSRCGRPSMVFGKEIRLCGGRWKFEIESFTPESLTIVKTLMNINYEICRSKKQ